MMEESGKLVIWEIGDADARRKINESWKSAKVAKLLDGDLVFKGLEKHTVFRRRLRSVLELQ